MDTRTVPTQRLDGLEAERFREMLASPPFALLTARLKAQLEREREACERSDDRTKLLRAQGAAAALRVALGLPGQLLTEITKK
jgi:hypothetical protein